MDKKFSIAVILSAQDKLTRVFDKATKDALKNLEQFQKKSNALARKSFGIGRDASIMGVAAGAALSVPTKAFAELEDAGLRLQSVMMKDGGAIDSRFNQINNLALKLGDQLPGTTADFQRMFAAMLSGGVSAESVLGGVGEAAAHMAVVLNMSYDATASFSSKLKTATGVADNEMNALLDTLVKVSNVLPGADASEKAGQMEEAFARSGGQLKNFGLQGLQASKQVSTLYAMLIRGGAHGETVGTGFGKILEAFYDKKKMANFNSMASSMGLSFDFIDQKSGDFKGIEHMVEQFDKMKNLSTLGRTNLITALVGDGQDSNFIKMFANLGISGYNEMSKAINEQATLDQRTALIGSSIFNKWDAATGTVTNVMAKFGETVKPILIAMIDKLNALAISVGNFVQHHPGVAKFILMAVGGFAAVMTVVGSLAFTIGSFARVFGVLSTGFTVGIRAVTLLGSAFGILGNVIRVVTAFMWANPILAIIGAIALSAYLIISNWETVKKWFNNFMTFMRNNKWAQLALFLANPFVGAAVTIGLYWDKLKLWAQFLYVGIKYEFMRLGNWLTIDLPNKMKEAGGKMMQSLKDGIKSFAMAPIDAIKNVAGKIRDFFPFSPAKTGPLRDIHRIKLMETVAASIKPAPILKAMRNVTAATMLAGGAAASAGNSGSGGGAITIHFSPVIHAGAGTNVADIQAMLKGQEKELLKVISEAMRKKERTKFD